MSDLSELYQQLILDHNRVPRNFGRHADAQRDAHGVNPLCGDDYQVFISLDGDTVSAVSFEGAGCAISKAAASLMTEAVIGKTLSDVADLFRRYHELATGRAEPPGDDLGKLAALSGVSEFPVRVKCATLPWHTLNAAIGDDPNTVSTE